MKRIFTHMNIVNETSHCQSSLHISHLVVYFDYGVICQTLLINVMLGKESIYSGIIYSFEMERLTYVSRDTRMTKKEKDSIPKCASQLVILSIKSWPTP